MGKQKSAQIRRKNIISRIFFRILVFIFIVSNFYFRSNNLYLWIINVSFGVRFIYTNGNVIYRREVFKSIKPKSNSFFYQAECLIRGVRSGFTFIEVPVQLRKGLRGHSKALSLKSFCTLAYDFMHLFYEMHIKG